MLARKAVPDRYRAWNTRHHAPYGRRGRGYALRFGLARNLVAARYITPYGWQPNNTIRRFEYPWAFEQVEAAGRNLRILDVGAGLAGFQFTLAQAGHDVHAIDPGMNAKGRGWEIDPQFHAFLGRAYNAPVTLWPTTIADAGLEDDSFDVVLSVSTIEHFASQDLAEFVRESRRVLKSTGLWILTVDLFIDVQPFTSLPANKYGRNIDVRDLLDGLSAELVVGQRDELCGFDQFNTDYIQSNLASYLIGEGYPGLAQCFVARPR